MAASNAGEYRSWLEAPATWNLETGRKRRQRRRTQHQQRDDEYDAKEATHEVENEHDEGMQSIMTFEPTNTTSANTNKKTILEREAHVVALQEHCFTPAQIKSFQAMANN